MKSTIKEMGIEINHKKYRIKNEYTLVEDLQYEMNTLTDAAIIRTIYDLGYLIERSGEYLTPAHGSIIRVEYLHNGSGGNGKIAVNFLSGLSFGMFVRGYGKDREFTSMINDIEPPLTYTEAVEILYLLAVEILRLAEKNNKRA